MNRVAVRPTGLRPSPAQALRRFGFLCLAIAFAPMTVFADEGMYLFNELPTKLLKERHDFDIDQEWADRLRLSSVRLNSGGSGSFISSNGLVLTNHHVAFDTLQKLSTPDRDLIQNGFLAKSFEEELRAPDLELNQLVSIEDVTERVNAAVPPGTSAEEAFPLRRAAMSTIEQESKDETGLRSDVVTLFGGAKYHLYRFRVFDDVRLVWAPETSAAFFGGDADNFEYPRYNIDAAIMRVYENGEPAVLENFLRWSDAPLAEGELVFVSGHPGRTQRIFTTDALTFLRDDRIPFLLNLLRRREVLMQQYSLKGTEAKRRARDDVFGIQNSRKAYTGMQAGLLDPRVMAEKRGRESRLLAAIQENDELRELASAWEEIAAVQKEKRVLLPQTASIRTSLAEIAHQIVLLGEENLKPNDQRFREYTDASRESLLRGLLSEAPIYADLEQFKLADELTRLAESRGADDPLVVELLVGKGPRQRAAEMVQATELFDKGFRQSLVDGGKTAVLASSDPLIRMARLLEPEYRRLRELNDRLEERERQAYAKITKATSAIEGTGGYPDATFTLRLAFGTVKSYQQDGETIPPATTFAGAFEHSDNYVGPEDFQLPSSWHLARSRVNLDTQINFVCTADIIGGNSGSPVVNRAGELVGLIFDGNIQSLTSDYLYTDTQARAVSVSAVGIKEALKNVYQAADLVKQIGR
ncbi:MAG: S46 family peptidase [Planctomycetaceae bacterium]|nr:MAG: S46 family peptidase [Planctomycetaceae bacterium]